MSERARASAYHDEYARLLAVHAGHRQRLRVMIWADWAQFFHRFGEHGKAAIFEARIIALGRAGRAQATR